MKLGKGRGSEVGCRGMVIQIVGDAGRSRCRKQDYRQPLELAVESLTDTSACASLDRPTNPYPSHVKFDHKRFDLSI